MAMPDNQVHADHTRPEAMIQDQTKYPLWCNGCDTDSYIVIECARKPHWAPPGTLDIAYFCSRCHSLYGHLVKESELQANFAAAVAAARHR